MMEEWERQIWKFQNVLLCLFLVSRRRRIFTFDTADVIVELLLEFVGRILLFVEGSKQNRNQKDGSFKITKKKTGIKTTFSSSFLFSSRLVASNAKLTHPPIAQKKSCLVCVCWKAIKDKDCASGHKRLFGSSSTQRKKKKKKEKK